MARPKATDPVENRPVGLPASLWAIVEVAAQKAGQSRSAWVREAVKSALHLNDKPSGESSEACKHPVNRRIGASCAVCGKKLA